MPQTMTCPMCREEVPPRAASCRSCHLPIADVARHQGSIRSRRSAAVRTRLWGLAICAGLVAWCVVALPTAVTFVVPAAVVAGVLHVVRGRPVLAALVFVVIVVAAPAQFWPSMLTDVLDGFGSLV